MNRLALTRRLPLMLGIALRLRDTGADDTCIAAALDIEPAGVRSLLEVAENRRPMGSRNSSYRTGSARRVKGQRESHER